jgi:O-antigen ligase
MLTTPSAYSRFIVVAVAASTGIVIARSPWQVTTVLVVLGTFAAALVLARAGLTEQPYSAEDFVEPGVRADRQLRPPRLVFYAGAGLIGLLTVRPAMAFTISDWIFFACLALTTLALLTSSAYRDYRVPAILTIGVGIFAVGGFVSSFGAVQASASVSVIARVLYLTLVWFWLATTLLRTRRHVENALILWIGSVAVSCLGAVVQYRYGDVIPGGETAWGRMSGFTPHYNHLGGLVATSFVPALMLATDSSRRGARLYALGVTGVLALGLVLSGSVGGMTATLVSTVFWLVVRGLSLRTVVRLGALAAAGFVLVISVSGADVQNPAERLQRVTSAQEAAAGTGGSFYTRVEVYERAWDRIGEQPLIGVGLDDASSLRITGGENLVHNMLLSQLFTAGILGLLGIVVVLVGAGMVGATEVRRSSGSRRALTSALLAGFVGFVVFSMGEPVLFIRYGWFPVALLLALRAQAARAEESKAHLGIPRSTSADAPLEVSP